MTSNSDVVVNIQFYIMLNNMHNGGGASMGSVHIGVEGVKRATARHTHATLPLTK